MNYFFGLKFVKNVKGLKFDKYPNKNVSKMYMFTVSRGESIYI